MKKKFLSLVLACALTIGSLPCAVWADDYTGDVGTPMSTSKGADTAGTTVTYPNPITATLVDTRTEGAIASAELVENYAVTVGTAGDDSFVPVTLSGTNLKKHQNGEQEMGYWAGVAWAVPEGQSVDGVKAVIRLGKDNVTAEAVAAATTNTSLDTIDGKQGIAQYLDISNSAYSAGKFYAGIQWMNGENEVGTVQFYEVDFSGVTMYQEAPAITYPTAVVAPLVDHSDNPVTDLYTTYKIEAYHNTVEFTATDLKKHTNANGKEGYWVGFALAAPTGADGFKFSYTDSIAADAQVNTLEQNIDGNDAEGVAFYFDVSQYDVTGANVSVQWMKGEDTLGDTQSYGVSLSGVQLYKEVAVTGVSLSATTANLYTGGSVDLTATITPDNATDKTVTWSTSDADVATVANGKVTAVAAGTATITATAGEKSATCKVTVTAPAASVDNASQLAQAIADATAGDVITLSQDITLDAKLTIDKAITIAGNGHKITGASADAGVYIEVTGGNVIIQDVELTGFGSGLATEVADNAVIKVPADATVGKLTMENVTTNGVNRAGVVVRQGTFKINNCNFDCTNVGTEKLTKGVLINGATGDITNTTITNAVSTYEDWSTAAIEVWGTSTVNVKDCVLGTASAKVQNGVSVTPEGGKANVTITNTDMKATSRCVVMHPDENNGTAIATVDGGLMVSDFMVGSNVNPYAGAFKVNSGEGCTLSVKSVTVANAFDVLRAIECAASSGVTITLSADLDLTSFATYLPDGLVVKDKTITLKGDADGKTVSGSTITAGDKASLIFGENVTVSSGLIADNGGTINLAGAAYTGQKTDLVKNEGGTLIITAGTFDFDPTEFVPSGYKVTKNTADSTTVADTWTVTKKSSGGGGGGGSSSKKDDTKTETKDEVKTDTPAVTEPTTIEPGEATTSNINKVFNDTKSSDWYAEAAAYVYNNGLMKGNDDGSFGANDNATRGQIVTILHRLANEPDAGDSTFKDINGNEYYADGVAWAAANGIVNGYEDGTFNANGKVTREELATILYRFAKAQGWVGETTGDLTAFADSDTASDWATEALAWAVGNGLLKGDETGALNPTGTATRAEIATILMRFCENIAK